MLSFGDNQQTFWMSLRLVNRKVFDNMLPISIESKKMPMLIDEGAANAR
jgi:hypothetical protein